MNPVLVLLFLFAPLASRASKVVLPEDEFILPPLLNRLEEKAGKPVDGINVHNGNQQARRAVSGEWLDYGDRVELPPELSFQVLQNEDLAWVGGGVFRGTLGKYRLSDDSVAQYSLQVERGWVKVWMNPSKHPGQLRIEANGEAFVATDAEFWIHVRNASVEIFLVRGNLLVSGLKELFSGRKFMVIPSGKRSRIQFGSDWDPKAIEVQIAESYPGFVRMVDSTDQDWEKGTLREAFARFRKTGWRKAHRFTPDRPLKSQK